MLALIIRIALIAIVAWGILGQNPAVSNGIAKLLGL